MNNREWKLKSWFFLLFFTSCTSINTTTADHYLIFVHRLFFFSFKGITVIFCDEYNRSLCDFWGVNDGVVSVVLAKERRRLCYHFFFQVKKMVKNKHKSRQNVFLEFLFKNRKWCRHCLRFVSVSVSSIVFSLLTSFCEPHLVPLQPQILRQIWPLSCWSCFCFGLLMNSLKPS